LIPVGQRHPAQSLDRFIGSRSISIVASWNTDRNLNANPSQFICNPPDSVVIRMTPHHGGCEQLQTHNSANFKENGTARNDPADLIRLMGSDPSKRIASIRWMTNDALT
jgi:hypothetical protein